MAGARKFADHSRISTSTLYALLLHQHAHQIRIAHVILSAKKVIPSMWLTRSRDHFHVGARAQIVDERMPPTSDFAPGSLSAIYPCLRESACEN